MIAKLRVLSGTLVHASGGETFWPVQFGFLAKLPAFFGCIIELSGMPGDISRKAVGGTAGSCVVAQAVSRHNESEAQVFFMCGDPFLGMHPVLEHRLAPGCAWPGGSVEAASRASACRL